jgi:hypothetical protein
MKERRAIPRHKVFKAGSIEFDSGGVDCTIHNVSDIGAGIEVASSFGIPHEVTLNILTLHVRQHGYVVWRKEKRMGVTFV